MLNFSFLLASANDSDKLPGAFLGVNWGENGGVVFFLQCLVMLQSLWGRLFSLVVRSIAGNASAQLSNYAPQNIRRLWGLIQLPASHGWN